MKRLLANVSGLVLLLLSVSGQADTEIAAYQILETNDKSNIELRNYPRLVLVSTSMGVEGRRGQNGAFGRLFRYISGDNISRDKIAMTAPVFMTETPNESAVNEDEKIAMTAPVFVGDTDQSDGEALMSFVLPASYTEEMAPLPKDDKVKLHSVKDYKVAAIRFSGRLNERNIAKNKVILEKWISQQGYTVVGPYQSAGYNPPYTLPFLRRNEVLIPVTLPN